MKKMNRVRIAGMMCLAAVVFSAWIFAKRSGSGSAQSLDGTPAADSAVATAVDNRQATPGPFAASHVAAKPVVMTERPRVEIQSREFDFGIVEPLRAHRHTFQVRNAGATPLKISGRKASCKCLKLEVKDPIVEPGQIGCVDVIWEARPTQDIFLQRATIITNDPTNATVEFTVMGKARMILAAEPGLLAASRIKPNESTRLETKIISQTWEAFTIDEVRPSLAGVQWELFPISPSDIERLEARSGWRLVVTLPADLPEGRLNEQIVIVARPAADLMPQDDPSAQPIEREIPLEGNVIRRLAVYGKDINSAGTINVGVVDRNKGYTGKFTLRVNDDQPELRVTNVESYPETVHATVEQSTSADPPGMYRLLVHIPPSDVPGVFKGENRDRLTISFDHPRIKTLELGVEFIVLKTSNRFGGVGVAAARDP